MEVPRHWRLKKQRYAMVGEVCSNCKMPSFPPRAVCPHCGGDAKRRLAYAEQPEPVTVVAVVEGAQVYSR